MKLRGTSQGEERIGALKEEGKKASLKLFGTLLPMLHCGMGDVVEN